MPKTKGNVKPRPGPACPKCASAIFAVLRTVPKPTGWTRLRRCCGCGFTVITPETFPTFDTGITSLTKAQERDAIFQLDTLRSEHGADVV